MVRACPSLSDITGIFEKFIARCYGFVISVYEGEILIVRWAFPCCPEHPSGRFGLGTAIKVADIFPVLICDVILADKPC
jgi:hypothetical protein